MANLSENEQSTIKALEESISVWEKKLSLVRNGVWRKVKFGPISCPLCRIYHRPLSDCAGCPVDRDTGGRHCKGSPFIGVCAAIGRCWWCDSSTNVNALEAAVKNELEYLRDLLEKETKGSGNERN